MSAAVKVKVILLEMHIISKKMIYFWKLMLCGKDDKAMLVEVKTKLTTEYIKEHIEHLEKFENTLIYTTLCAICEIVREYLVNA